MTATNRVFCSKTLPLTLDDSGDDPMRHLSTLALAGLFGSLLLAGDASACHKKKCACPAPAPVCAPAPVMVCAPAPVCAPKKTCHFKMPKMTMPKLCHKKATCAPMVYETMAPMTPMATPQATPQATMQSM
jgi:hypothetical protein